MSNSTEPPPDTQPSSTPAPDTTPAPVTAIPSFLAPSLTPTTLTAKDSKHDHIKSLLENLSLVVSLLLATIYLHDNLTFLLLLRASSQHVHIQSMPITQSTQPSSSFPAVLLANFICVLTHLIRSKPEAEGKWSRGYLHGGLIVDFVGELGPTSKLKLVLLDFMVLALQTLTLMVMNEQQKMRTDRKPQQDVEAEEEGRRRSQSQDREDDPMLPNIEDEDGIEMQNFGDTRGRERRKRTREEDMIMTIDLRKGMRELFQRPSTDSSSVAANATGVDRVNTLISRLVARANTSAT